MSVELDVALVVGGASGIGAACARALAGDGFRVVVADLNLDAAGEVAAALPHGAVALAIDVTDPTSVAAVVQRIEDSVGRLTAAVNSAGIGAVPTPVGDYSDADWRRVMSVNLDGVFHCLRAEVGAMMRHGGGGSVVNVSSVMGLVAVPGAPAYTAAKHAVIGLTKSSALDYAHLGIRVNALAPAFIRTPFLEAHADEERLAALAALHPVGRLGTAEEVAALASWLCSPAASFVTGSVQAVDGGYLAR